MLRMSEEEMELSPCFPSAWVASLHTLQRYRTAPAQPESTEDAHKFTASDFRVVCAPCRQLNPRMEGSAWQWEGFLLTEQISSKSPCRRG